MTIVILGANGQLGRALVNLLPWATLRDRASLDITDAVTVENYDWRGVTTVINAAAYTDVDGAETPRGGRIARAVNTSAVGYLADAATKHDFALVHVSSDYVFDGKSPRPYAETAPMSPLNVYGATKAAGDELAAGTPRHYIVRTAWVIGDGPNFVRTMVDLGRRGISPTVVADQIGRPTFTTTLAAGIVHLLESPAPYGTYNVTNSGPLVAWVGLARRIFALKGYDLAAISKTSTEYYADKPAAAQRPHYSALDNTAIKATGFTPCDWQSALEVYLASADVEANLS